MKGKTVIIGISLLTLTACSGVSSRGTTLTTIQRAPINELQRDPVPGTVNDVWVEPMYDTIRVPGRLDPKNVYYRKAHNELVEIRPGRFQLQQYPDEDSGSPEAGNQ
jgi:hypothetical protein